MAPWDDRVQIDYLKLIAPMRPVNAIIDKVHPRHLEPKGEPQIEVVPSENGEAKEWRPPSKLIWYTDLEKVGYVEDPDAPKGLTKRVVDQLHAKVKRRRNLELRPSTLDWPEVIAALKPSLGLEVIFLVGLATQFDGRLPGQRRSER